MCLKIDIKAYIHATGGGGGGGGPSLELVCIDWSKGLLNSNEHALAVIQDF